MLPFAETHLQDVDPHTSSRNLKHRRARGSLQVHKHGHHYAMDHHDAAPAQGDRDAKQNPFWNPNHEHVTKEGLQWNRTFTPACPPHMHTRTRAPACSSSQMQDMSTTASSVECEQRQNFQSVNAPVNTTSPSALYPSLFWFFCVHTKQHQTPVNAACNQSKQVNSPKLLKRYEDSNISSPCRNWAAHHKCGCLTSDPSTMHARDVIRRLRSDPSCWASLPASGPRPAP